MKKIIIAIGLIVVLIGCNKKTEFFQLKSLTHKSNRELYEYIVISNPPKEDLLFIKVDNFIRNRNNHCEISKEFDFYRCFFYKETWDTPRDYKEEDPEGGFSSDMIGYHIDDLVATARYNKSEGWLIEIKTNNNPDEWRYYSCDSIFVK